MLLSILGCWQFKLNTNMYKIDLLKWGLRLFFWITLTLAMRQGSLFAIGLCLTVFLVMEYLVEDLENTVS